MKKEELKAMLSTAKKLGWNGKPAATVILILLAITKSYNLSEREQGGNPSSLIDVLNDLALAYSREDAEWLYENGLKYLQTNH